MKNTLFTIIMMLAFAGCTNEEQTATNITPVPQKVETGNGVFTADRSTVIVVNAGKEDYDRLHKALQPLGLQTADKVTDNCILAQISKEVTHPEGYRITTDKNGIKISAATGAGLFYGVQTVLQQCAGGSGMPYGTITDEPRFAYRGIMLDVSRHFFGKEFIKKQIDAMAAYKLNRLHLHLTDAAGWRVEIKQYPRLTQFAAWRKQPVWKDWWNDKREYAEEGSSDAHGGYLTQDEIRELAAYAAERYITIIPEIEMPAHSEEVLTAYPELSCTHEPYKQADFCVGNEKTFEFLQNVLDEITELFPSEYIHIGGDEAGKASWPSCPLCRKRMHDEGMQDVNELQSYLIHRIEKYLNGKGRQIIGWDEILDGGLAPNATVMSWRGTEGGIKAVEAGHKAIMSPGTHCYLDQYQDAPHTQPEAIGGYLPLKKVYSYDPIPDSIAADKHHLIYGVQGNLWAEYIPTAKHAEYMLYPRLLAIAEVAWSNPEVKNYKDFRRRALQENMRLRNRGYNTFDLYGEVGNRPEAEHTSNHIARGKQVAYAKGSPYYPGYAASGKGALTDGEHGSWNNNDGVWQGFIGRGGIDVTIDLEQQKQIKSISATFMQLCNPGIFHPAEVTISASCDSITFEELAHIEHTVVRDDTLSFKKYGWQGNTKARYIRYKAQRSNFGGFMFTDEIEVY